MESEICGIAGPTPCRIVHVFRVHHHFLQVAVLAEVLHTLQLALRCYFRGDPNDIDECLLDDTEVGEFFYFLPRQV